MALAFPKKTASASLAFSNDFMAKISMKVTGSVSQPVGALSIATEGAFGSIQNWEQAVLFVSLFLKPAEASLAFVRLRDFTLGVSFRFLHLPRSRMRNDDRSVVYNAIVRLPRHAAGVTRQEFVESSARSAQPRRDRVRQVRNDPIRCIFYIKFNGLIITALKNFRETLAGELTDEFDCVDASIDTRFAFFYYRSRRWRRR